MTLVALGACVACGDSADATSQLVGGQQRNAAAPSDSLSDYVPPDLDMPDGLGVPTPFENVESGALEPFYRALDRAHAGTSQARIAIWGGSHTACDHWTGTLRDALQRSFGDAGHGFTLPAWPSDRWDYWRWGVQVSRGEGWDRLRLGWHRGEPDDYGAAGLVFDSAGRGATAEVRTASWGIGQRASAIEVWTQTRPEGGTLNVFIDGEQMAEVNTEGEVRARFDRFDVPDGPHAVRLETHGRHPVRLYGVVLERNLSGVIVDNFAISGSRARNHEKWLERTFAVQLGRRPPHLVIFAYGGNEANDDSRPIALYARATRYAITRIRRIAPHTSCLFVGPTDKPESLDGRWVDRPRTQAIIDVQREIARTEGCAFFDTRAFMGGPLSMLRWVAAEPPLAREDHVHLSARGYRALGTMLASNLLEGWRTRHISPVQSDP